MARINPKSTDTRKDTTVKLAGGVGTAAATQGPEALLRRAVMACLLWEDLAYEKGSETVTAIQTLIPQVAPDAVAAIARESRLQQKLRHVPLLIVREMARLATHKHLVAGVLADICTRPDMETDFWVLYDPGAAQPKRAAAWRTGVSTDPKFPKKREPLSKQVKRGLRLALAGFDEYQLAKWRKDDAAVKLRDLLFMIHAKPRDDAQAALWKRMVDGKMVTPDTWEVALSTGQDKKAAWTRLIETKKLPALALLRNLANMQKAGVDHAVIAQGLDGVNSDRLLPLNFLAARKAAPDFSREIEAAMLRVYGKLPKLPGWTVFVLDVSGSMRQHISSKSDFSRLDAGIALMTLASEQAERVTLYLTAGSDATRKHTTEKIAPVRGFAMYDVVTGRVASLGGGGIFTRQALEHIKTDLNGQVPDRIIVLTDSQDMDHSHQRIPAPFGRHNYILDVSAHTRGINYDGVWTSEISGWSEHAIAYIVGLEAGLSASTQ